MKSLKSFFSLFVVTMLVASVASFSLHTDPVLTTLAVGTVNTGFYLLTSFNIISLPKNVLGTFIGVPGVSAPDGGAGIQVISTERDRAIHLNNSMKAEFAGKDLVPGYLRLESVVTNNNNTLDFPTFTGDATLVYPTEKRLNRSDAFIVTEYGFYLLKQDVANKKTNGLLYSYPNITVFGAGPAADLMALYTSGKLNVEIDNKRWLPDVDILRFLQIPQVQQSGAANFDETNLAKSLKHATPQFVINGNGNNKLNVKFENYAGFAGASAVAGTEFRGVLYFHGFYVLNGNATVS